MHRSLCVRDFPPAIARAEVLLAMCSTPGSEVELEANKHDRRGFGSVPRHLWGLYARACVCVRVCPRVRACGHPSAQTSAPLRRRISLGRVRNQCTRTVSAQPAAMLSKVCLRARSNITKMPWAFGKYLDTNGLNLRPRASGVGWLPYSGTQVMSLADPGPQGTHTYSR